MQSWRRQRKSSPGVAKSTQRNALQIRFAGFRETGQCSAGGRTGRLLQSIKTVRRLTVGGSARSESIPALSVDKMTVVDGSVGQPTTRNVALTENRSGSPATLGSLLRVSFHKIRSLET